MEYSGQVRGGVVVFENGTPPEGAKVRVAVLAPEIGADAAQRDEGTWSKLLEVAGTVEGLPPDMAEQHDHYIHGTPKRK
jgi:hypothetical protein